MARAPKGVRVTVLRRPFACPICGEKVFLNKEISIRTTLMSTPVIGLVCTGCSYIHTFLDGGKVDMFRPDLGYQS